MSKHVTEIDRPLWMDCKSQLQLQQQYRITEFGRSAEFPRIPWNSGETWKFHGNGQIPRLGSKFRSPRKTVVPTHHRSRIRYLSKKNSRILTNFPKLKKIVKIRKKFVKCPSGRGLPTTTEEYDAFHGFMSIKI